MNPSRPLHAELAELRASGHELRVQLLTAEGVLTVQVPLGRAAGLLLRHLHAIYGHAPGCECADEDVHVGLLLRTAAAAGADSLQLILHPGEPPSFWLQIDGARGRRHVEVGALDAFSLLAGGRIPVLVDAAPSSGARSQDP